MQVNVTNLSLFHMCPRTWACHLWKVGHVGTGVLPGRIMHAIISNIHTDLAKSSQKRGFSRENYQKYKNLMHIFKNPKEKQRDVFLDVIRREYFIPFLQSDESKELTTTHVLALAKALEFWGNYLIDFIVSCIKPNHSSEDISNLLNEIFQYKGGKMESYYTFEDGELLKITGVMDAVLFDPAKMSLCCGSFRV